MNFDPRMSLMAVSAAALSSVLLASCEKKEPIIIPTACSSPSETMIEVGDSVVFTNCSVAQHAAMYFVRENHERVDYVVFEFNEMGEYTRVFNHEGVFNAVTTARNDQPGSPWVESSETITVN